jgi:hypothetical protein
MNMKGTYKSLLSITLLVSLCFALQTAHAGNKDRSGQAAAQHLLINPWGASNGWGNVGVAATKELNPHLLILQVWHLHVKLKLDIQIRYIASDRVQILMHSA